MRFGPKSFSDETVLTEHLKVFGPVTARNNLSVPSMKITGPISIRGTLDVYEGSMIVNGPIDISGDMIVQGDCKINGPCDVRGSIEVAFIKFNVPLLLSLLMEPKFGYPKKLMLNRMLLLLNQ